MKELIEHFNALAHYHRDKYYEILNDGRTVEATLECGKWIAYEDVVMYLADKMNK